MIWVFYILGSLLLVKAVIMQFRQPFWWIRLTDGMRFQISILKFFVAAGLLICFRPISVENLVFAIILIIIGTWNLLKVIPFTGLHKVEVSTSTNYRTKIKLLAANVRTCNRDFHRLLGLIEKISPDLILLTETDKEWLNALNLLEKIYPYHCLQPQENTYGMALYSKVKLRNTKVKFLVEKEVPSIHTEILLNDEIIQFIGLHPRPPAPWTVTGNKDLELIYAAGATNWNKYPSIVSGDLNDVGWSPVTEQFKKISGLLDPRIGRGLFATYNAFIPFFRVPIDHFFVSRHFKVLKMEKLGHIGSDHFPVMMEVTLN